MKREIKFRALLSVDRTWVYWGLFDPLPDYQMTGIDSDTTGQFTGLKDKNGKEIYEGDIVKYQGLEGFDYEDKEETISEVAFIDGAFVPVYLSTREHHNYEDEMIVVEDLEVIGNLYENPELLK